ncbi:hypothetical protein [Aliarcobacter butzleri]|uniref:hypothetical protein n=1 Tax=Aliarcobacter butzleri TaxID=28197 RepID=UPI001EDB4C28|nr:hypothetical protein [Aliarcobacter butzleri]MCG3707175.1 hypothetical protein [Aliarcobacter butzleri]MCT7573685.1 hypothetical protein [Aliarcobacter butzleri]MCT7644105.1 hypothetical protein [Aliarcobacter butzleri]
MLINILEDACTGLKKEEKSCKVIDTLKRLGLDGYWSKNIEEEYEIYCLYENELNLSTKEFETLCFLTKDCALEIGIRNGIINVG